MYKKTSTENKKLIIKVVLNQSKYRGNVATNYNKKNSRYIKYREFSIIEIKSIRIIQPLPLQQRSQQPLQEHQPSL